MKKLIILFLLILCCSFLTAETRLKLGITDYDPKIKDFDFNHGIYRFHTRLDFLDLHNEIGAGTNLNITFKSDNDDIDHLNQYDFYVHKFHTSFSSDGTYMLYGIYSGVRVNYIKTYSAGFHGKANYRFSRFMCGALISRNSWGSELTISQNLDHDWKFDWSTKYQYMGLYYFEFMVSSASPMEGIPDEVSFTFGVELVR